MYVKKCIWCSREQPIVDFNKIAHTIPQSLGGKNICESVCDDCNSYFGNVHDKLPSIETALKETFNVSRLMFLDSNNQVGRNKALARFKSIYFKVDLTKRKVKPKPAYKLRKNFQTDIARQFKRGVFKIFLEERERQFGDAADNRFDFIREFSRYNMGDFPVLYFYRQIGGILMSKEWSETPELFMKKEDRMKYLIDDFNFFEFELLGHVIGIPTSRHYHLTYDSYIKETTHKKSRFFKGFKPIEHFNDFDLTLNVFKD